MHKDKILYPEFYDPNPPKNKVFSADIMKKNSQLIITV